MKGISRYIMIMKLNVNGLNSLFKIDTDWLNGLKNRNPLSVAYQKHTSLTKT